MFRGLVVQWPRRSIKFEISANSKHCPHPGFEELAHAAEFFVALFEQHGGRERQKIAKRAIEDWIEERGGSLMVHVRAAFWFGNNFIDDTELAQIARRDLEGFRSHFRFGRIAPQNRGAALRGNYGIDGILKHINAISHSDGQRAA